MSLSVLHACNEDSVARSEAEALLLNDPENDRPALNLALVFLKDLLPS